jgi:hypothetical protein
MVFSQSEEEWITKNIQIYFFQVCEFVVWKNSSRYEVSDTFIPKLVTYNSNINTGIILGTNEIGS